MKALAIASVLVAATLAVHGQTHPHVIATPGEAQWGAAPPMLPPGAQIAVLSGDPTKPVSYAVRLKFPANYVIPAHSHPTDENVVVTSGSVTFGVGDKVAKGSAGNKTLTAGGYALQPADMNHYAFTTSEATIVLFGIGPVEFKYVNPADDPRNSKSTSR